MVCQGNLKMMYIGKKKFSSDDKQTQIPGFLLSFMLENNQSNKKKRFS